MFRTSQQDYSGLMAADLAGAATCHCHGNQPQGGKQSQVSAVLARHGIT